MLPELARALERQRQNRERLAANVQKEHTVTFARARVGSGTFSAGDRVFDLVSGEEGVVVHGTAENVIGPVANG